MNPSQQSTISLRPAYCALRTEKAFSLAEIIITLSLFFLLAGTGIGVYFNYYKSSMVRGDVDNVMTLMKNYRFRALKNPTNSDYGVHIDQGLNAFVGFREAYVPNSIDNQVVKLNDLRIEDLNLSPDIGYTNQILFRNKTGKTDNTGSFVIGNDSYHYTFNINSQGVIN